MTLSVIKLIATFFRAMLSIIMLSVIMLSVIMLSVIMLSVIMLSVIMLSVIMLSVIMLSDNKLIVIFFIVILSVSKCWGSVIILIVVAPFVSAKHTSLLLKLVTQDFYETFFYFQFSSFVR